MQVTADTDDGTADMNGLQALIFDVDGTLTIPRKVRARVRSGLREPTPRVLLLSPPLRVASAFAPD